MMRTTLKTLGVAALAGGLLSGALGGCTPEYHQETHGLGETSAQNFLLQAVDPRPSQVTAAPDQDGQRAAAAYERYRDGKVIKPSRVTTSELASGGTAAK